jgi:hypothetical protein
VLRSRARAAQQDPAAVAAALADARTQLELIRRQARATAHLALCTACAAAPRDVCVSCDCAMQTAISRMYTHTESVMDQAKPAWQVKAVPLAPRQ